ncbi:tetratricopeptide (TPR) repeat protein [Amaricoccus macauensis]|uniref:Tetratricopeptide (TPR) repeat protein n=1 Tax=Amaricoccus macauensis TaxID=57001 RepID=A0A840SK94_9RHOB|nr:hypothetical protein [Amaricoccus macauensis]MBB5222357.1 tetratricopeptide (TPR) repeat protein [Amaricoccus macauensis]
MPAFTITTWMAFANFAVASWRLAVGPAAGDRLAALTDILSGKCSLDAAFATTGLDAIAAEVERTAEEQAQHFTHAGPARDDAIALFKQVASDAFAHPATFAAGRLDPALITEGMVAALRGGPHAPDFFATPLPEQFFRSVARATLEVMLNRADIIAALSPALWREQMAMTGEIRADTSEIRNETAAIKDVSAETLALVREHLEIKETTVPEIILIAMARKILPHVATRDEALRTLDAAADRAAESLASGEAGSNVDTFVDATLRELATLTAHGRLDAAAQIADHAVSQAKAGYLQLLEAAIRQHLIASDAEGAARYIVEKLAFQYPDARERFAAFAREWHEWHQRGDNAGMRVDHEVSVALARITAETCRDPEDRDQALLWQTMSLTTLGARETSGNRFREALQLTERTLSECDRSRTPKRWAHWQKTLGNLLSEIGSRDPTTGALPKAICAYRKALQVCRRHTFPGDWAGVKMNLGAAYRRIGEGEDGTRRLRYAVTAIEGAAAEFHRLGDRKAAASAAFLLGNVLTTLGQKEDCTARLREAVAAYRSSLAATDRRTYPADWALRRFQLGNVLRMVGARDEDPYVLLRAAAAIRPTLKELWERDERRYWIAAKVNFGDVLRTFGDLKKQADIARCAISVYREVLEVIPRRDLPKDWGTAKEGLARALAVEADLADLRHAPSRVRHAAALVQIDDAITAFEEAGAWPDVRRAVAFRESLADR